MKKNKNFKRVISVFEKNYTTIPLEIFSNNPYKTLISTVLSSRTRDETTLLSSNRLFNKAPNIIKLGQLNRSAIAKLIYPVGFYKIKAKQLTILADKIQREYKGKIPNDRNELMKLPGVGRKTANLVLNRAYNIPAIAVDTHVHRISNLLGWVRTKNAIQTERELNNILPRKYWSDINRLFVSIGRKYRSKKQLKEFLLNNKLIVNLN